MITEINTNMKLSEHFSLAELTKTKQHIENVPIRGTSRELKAGVPMAGASAEAMERQVRRW